MSETWVINESPNFPDNGIYTYGNIRQINYILEDDATTYLTKTFNDDEIEDTFAQLEYGSMGFGYAGGDGTTYIAQYTMDRKVGTTGWQSVVYSEETSWSDVRSITDNNSVLLALRTITFDEPPTGDLLTWLNSNAVKQEPETWLINEEPWRTATVELMDVDVSGTFHYITSNNATTYETARFTYLWAGVHYDGYLWFSPSESERLPETGFEYNDDFPDGTFVSYVNDGYEPYTTNDPSTYRMLRTVTFDEPLIGDLLALFEEIAVKQQEPLVTDDLTGWTWVGNETLNINLETSFSEDLSFYYEGDFDPDNRVECAFIELSSTNQTMRYYNIDYGDLVSVYYDGHYEQNYLNTLHFTGGTDATNTELIKWLQDNGTLIKNTGHIEINDTRFKKVFVANRIVKSIWYGSKQIFSYIEKARLGTPQNVKIEDNSIISWDAVSGASSYYIKDYITGALIAKVNDTTINIVTHITDKGIFKLCVIATGDNFEDSNPSDRVEYVNGTRLAAPINVHLSNQNANILIYSNIDSHANRFDIYVDNTLFVGTEELED